MSAGPDADAADLRVDFGPNEALELHRPELPTLSEIARYYALSEDARVYGDRGPCHLRLATRLAAYVDCVAAIPVANGTLGLTVALLEATASAGRAGRLVAAASFAPVSIARAIECAGLDPLWVDVDRDCWQLDPDALAAALDEHPGEVACVLGTSTLGAAAPARTRARWRESAGAHGVPLVIDSCAAFGAVDDDGRRLGGHPETEVFSFGATRPFAIGEGGAICVSDRSRAERLERIAGLGVEPATGSAVGRGLNARMSELSAAAGLAMLDRFDDVLARRRGTAAQVRAVLAGFGLSYQADSEGSTWPSFHVLASDRGLRDRALQVARELRIEARASCDPPLHRHPAFARAASPVSLPVTEELAGRAVTLPLANTLGPRQMIRLAELFDKVGS